MNPVGFQLLGGFILVVYLFEALPTNRSRLILFVSEISEAIDHIELELIGSPLIRLVLVLVTGSHFSEYLSPALVNSSLFVLLHAHLKH